ncbi:MAG: hypothetical protein ACK4NP_14575 [Parvularculaceae bacterium]
MKLPKKLPALDALSPMRRSVAEALNAAFGAAAIVDLHDNEAAERMAHHLAIALLWFAKAAPVSDALSPQLKLAAQAVRSAAQEIDAEPSTTF